MSDDSGNSQSQKKSQSFVTKIFGSKKSEEQQQQAEDEILSLIEEGKEKGYIEDDTKNIIENIFDFDDTVAYEIMTHRRDMTVLEDTDSLEQVIDTAIKSGHSRIPVYSGDIDSVIGVLYVKDLLRFVVHEKPKNFRLSDYVRKVLFVPRTKDCRSLFAEMTKRKIQIAIVVDEYGGTEGLITLEDLIEDILGSIQDEYDHEEEEIRKISDTKFTVDGSTSIDDVENIVGEKMPESDCDTVAGFILDKLGRVPDEGEHPIVETETLRLTALHSDDRRISKVLIEKK